MSNGNETQVAVRDSDVVANINGWGNERFLPFFQGSNFEAWKQDAALAVVESKDLRECMATEPGKISLIRALQRSSSSGLSLNPQKGESALVCISGKVNFWPMKNGIVKMALETGALEYIEANTVYEKDTFKIKKTARGDDYDFEPALDVRGAVKGYFAVAVLKTGRSVVEYWPHAQAEAHKKKFGKGLNNTASAWNTNADAMHEKSVLKALLSGLHLPRQVSRLLEMDNEADEAVTRDVTEPAAEKSGGDELADRLAADAEVKAEREREPPPIPAAAPALF
jgi:phage RecT family recombinase